jgi:hypothetical protein
MRRIILAVSLAALCLILWPVTASGVVMASPTLAIPVRVTAEGQNEPPDIVLPTGAGNWLWDLMMDRLTIPLGPAEQKTWPLWTGREQWFIADRRGDHSRGAGEGQTRSQLGFLDTAGSRIVSSVSAAQMSASAGTLVSETAISGGGQTCDSS